MSLLPEALQGAGTKEPKRGSYVRKSVVFGMSLIARLCSFEMAICTLLWYKRNCYSDTTVSFFKGYQGPPFKKILLLARMLHLENWLFARHDLKKRLSFPAVIAETTIRHYFQRNDFVNVKIWIRQNIVLSCLFKIQNSCLRSFMAQEKQSVTCLLYTSDAADE